MEAMEKAKKEKEAQQTTPDYAAGLVSPAIPVRNASSRLSSKYFFIVKQHWKQGSGCISNIN